MAVTAASHAAHRRLFEPPPSEILEQLREGAGALARVVAELEIFRDLALVDQIDAQLEGMRRHSQRIRAALNREVAK